MAVILIGVAGWKVMIWLWGFIPPSSSIIGSYWKDCYEVISRCNVLIANIDRVDMDASQKAIYQAEAKTIRALMYINLTMTYQDVPFLTALDH